MDLHERGRPPLFHQVWLWAIQKLASDGFCFLTEVKGRSSAEGEERGQGLEKNEGFEELSWSKAEPSDKKKKCFHWKKTTADMPGSTWALVSVPVCDFCGGAVTGTSSADEEQWDQRGEERSSD